MRPHLLLQTQPSSSPKHNLHPSASSCSSGEFASRQRCQSDRLQAQLSALLPRRMPFCSSSPSSPSRRRSRVHEQERKRAMTETSLWAAGETTTREIQMPRTSRRHSRGPVARALKREKARDVVASEEHRLQEETHVGERDAGRTARKIWRKRESGQRGRTRLELLQVFNGRFVILL